MNHRLVGLVQFAHHDAGAALMRTLSTLGYPARTLSPVEVCDDACDGRASAIVVLLGGMAPPELVLPALERAGAIPSLALFVAGQGRWERAILERCCDCAQWPCGEEELAFRLGRLSDAPGNADADAMDADISEILMDLNLVGRSTTFLETMRQVRRLARCDAPVLLEGETGTGKELVARAIHYLGKRADGPFVPVNCGALPDHLVENELFGHERGAFTDAKTGALGTVGEAAGGTLFLDEVESLSPKAQASLLRFLQNGEYRQLGGRQVRFADTRVIAASNADLHTLCGQREFRSDLYFRIAILSLTLPPLRTRTGDVELLATHFINHYCQKYGLSSSSLDHRCLALLREYPWPGNVRELENLVHRQVLMSEGLSVFLSPGAARSEPTAFSSELPLGGASFAKAKARAIESFEREYLTWLMEESKGNVTQAARLANKERRALGRLLKKHGIAPSSHP